MNQGRRLMIRGADSKRSVSMCDTFKNILLAMSQSLIKRKTERRISLCVHVSVCI